MSAETPETVLHRKARVGRDGFDAREMSPAKALRLALAKSAARLMDLVLVVRTVEQSDLPLAKLEEKLGDDGLLILLDGPDQARGAVRLDLQVVSALIEMQLKGQVKRAEATPRPFTQTDAAIAQPLINAMLEGFDETLLEAGITTDPDGFRFGDRIADARTLYLALTIPLYDHFRLMLDLAGGAKSGRIDILLPKRDHMQKSEANRAEEPTRPSLEQVALGAPVTLNAALGGVKYPLDEVCAWSAGTIVPLPPDILNAAHLLGAGQHVVASVSLGQLHGFRAVRLVDRASGKPIERTVPRQTAASTPAAPDLIDAVAEGVVPGEHGPEKDKNPQTLTQIDGDVKTGQSSIGVTDAAGALDPDDDLEALIAASTLPSTAA